MSKHKKQLTILLVVILVINLGCSYAILNDYTDSKGISFSKTAKDEKLSKNINHSDNKLHKLLKLNTKISNFDRNDTDDINNSINDSVNDTNSTNETVEEIVEPVHNYRTFYGKPSSWQDGKREYCLYAVTYDWDLANSYYGELTWNLKPCPEGQFTSSTDVDISIFGMEKSQSAYSFSNPHNLVANAIISIEKVRR